jgi:signal peptidase I
MKKRFIPLLALLLSLCIIVPVSIAQIMAADAVQINVTAKGGSVVIGDKTVKDGGKHSVSPEPESEEDKDITVSIKAEPDEGYIFGSWSVDSGTIDYENSETANLTVDVGTSPVTLTANFVKTVGIQAKSSNDAWGTVTASAEKAVPGGAGVTLTATPEDGYRLDGWTVSYTNGDPMVDYSSRVTIYTLTEDEGNNTATLAISETNTEAKPLTVTAHFEKADAGHFLSYDYCELQPLVFNLLPGYKKAASITGWSNDASEDIVVKFNELGSDNKVTALLGYTTWGGLKRVADGVEFKFDSADATNYSKGGIGQKLKIGADAYAVGFTMTDKDGTVKKGTILLQYPGRAQVEAENGKLEYNGTEYKNGDVITFTPAAEETVSAKAADGYHLKEWIIDGTTYAGTEDGSVTFTVPDKFFSIKPVFEKTLAAVTITAASSNAGGTVTASAEKAVPGGAGVTLTATPEDGYRLDGWTVSYTNGDPMVDYSSRVTIYTLTEDEGNNTATLAISETNTEAKPLTVTAHFEKADAGHFLSYDYCELQPLVFNLLPGYKKAASITGWSNDASEDIVVKFNELGSDNKVTALLGYTTWGGLKRVADGVEFKFDSADATNYSKGGIGQKLKIGADAYAVGFTMTDKDGTVKKGTILLQYPGRAQVEAENGKLEYNGTEYKNGDVITFTPAAEETVSAKAADGYHLKEWIIDGTTYAGTEDGSATFIVPNKFFSIKPVFEKTGDTPQGPGCATVDAEHGKLEYNGKEYKNGDVIVFTPGETVTVFVKVDEGYYLDRWNILDATVKDENVYKDSVTFVVPDAAFTIKPIFESKEGKVELNFHAINTGTGEDRPNALGSEGWYEKLHIYPFQFYTFDAQDLTIDEAIAKKNQGKLDNLYKAGYTGLMAKWPLYIEQGTGVLVAANTYPAFPAGVDSKATYICEDLTSTAADKLGDLVRYEDSQYRIQNSRLYIAFIANEDVTVNAKFHELGYYPFKAVSNDETMGTVEITPECLAGGTQQEATHVVMRAIPKDGYRFKEWIEADGSTYLSAEQKMLPIAQFVFGTKAASFTAVFEKSADSQPLPIQATSNPEGKATIEVKANGMAITSAKEDTSVVASVANVDEYYEFDHWEITTATEAAVSLISEEDCRNSSVEFTMPSVTEGVRIKAVLKERYVTLSWEVMKGGGSGYQGASDLANVEVSVNGSSVSNYTKVKKDDVISFSVTVNDTDKYVFEKVGKRVFRTGSTRIEETFTEYSGTFKLTEWTSISLFVCLNDKTEETARHDIELTQATGGTITSSNSTAQPNTTVTLTAALDSGYTLKSWIVKDEQQKTIAVTADKTNSNVGTFTMPKSKVTVTAEFEATAEITPTITSVALVKSDGSEVANGVPSGDNWTITIPDTVSAETVAKIPEGLSGLNLKIETPTGVTVKQMDGGGSWAGDWSKGDIVCWMPVGEEVTFKATAGTATKDYTIKLIYSGSGEPTESILSNGSATRISNSGAAVQFSSNVAGNYFYKVVNHSAAAPTVEEILASSNKGTASTGVNNITLSNLGDGARDIYIVVVDASNNRSVVLKIEIPAYGSIDVPDTGAYTITVKAPKGGTITPNRTKANAGDEIIVTVTPDSGYQMVADSLTYTLAVAGGETVKITNNRFTMPKGNVSISCQWETAATTSTGITGFSINGVAGAVNNSTNTITITMPRGTDVTKLTPVIATNGVKSLTPGNGETVNFTNAVTYTAAMEDGSSKTYTVTVYVDKGTLADQFWDKLTDFATQVPWWQYAEKQQSTSKYPKYW